MRWVNKDYKTYECLNALKEMAREFDEWEKQNIEKDDGN